MSIINIAYHLSLINYYLYVTFSNNIYQINRKLYKLISDYLPSNNDKLKNLINQTNAIDNTKKLSTSEQLIKILRLDINPTKLKYNLEEKKIEQEINNSLSQLTLSVTNRCNLRCKYCLYSGKFNGYSVNSKNNMNLETAIDAINYFVPRANTTDDPVSISYYGGEPLLSFELIKKTCDYTKSKFRKKEVKFHITTNGTLLDEAKAKYLINRNFYISVSLDGPKNVHDRYRRFINGKGSFYSIYKNLTKLKKLNKDYFYSKVKFQPVLSPPFRYQEVFDFFRNKNNIFNLKNSVSFNYVRDSESHIEFNKYDKKRQIQDANFLNQELDIYVNSEPIKEEQGFQKFFFKDVVRIHNRPKGFVEHFNEYLHVPGVCIPGIRKVFCDTKGNYHMCERIEETMPIGNTKTGLVLSKIRKILSEYKHISEYDCCKCWAFRLCSICFIHAIKDGKFDIEKKRSCCDVERNRISKSLSIYMEILEKNPSFFKNGGFEVVRK